MNAGTPKEPVIFLKPDTALLKPGHTFYLPSFSTEVHYETELVIKISKNCKHVEEQFSSRYYNEITVGIDFTARDLQARLKASGLPWELSKSFDGSAPVGKFFPVEKLRDKQTVPFRLQLNGKKVQEGNSKDMIFSIDHVVAFVSRFITLCKGDLIFTGTPSGVGPVAKGDHLEAYLEENKVLEVHVK